MRIKHLVLGLLLAFLPLAAGASPEPPWNNPVNCSGTIAAGNTAQKIANLPTPLHGYQLQNLSTDTLYFSDLTSSATSTAGSWQLSASGGSYNSPLGFAPGGSVYINGLTTGDAYTCEAW